MSEKKINKESTLKTIVVALLLCLVCSILVSVAAVYLKPLQMQNKDLDIKKNILISSGIIKSSDISKKEVLEYFSKIKTYLIDLESGKVSTDFSPQKYDARKMITNSSERYVIPSSKDVAGIKFRTKKAKVYLLYKDSELDQIILPVNGKGLWSTLYGFVALSPDASTIRGLSFYEHGETPGLGGEIDNPRWKAKWNGKIIKDSSENVAIEVVKGSVDTSSKKSIHQVDGLSGATLTCNGVTNLLKYWLSENGYGPFLRKISKSGGKI